MEIVSFRTVVVIVVVVVFWDVFLLLDHNVQD